MTFTRRRCLVLIASLAATAVECVAQSQASASTLSWCWRARPAPLCDRIVLTEAAWLVGVRESRTNQLEGWSPGGDTYTDVPGFIAFNLGILRNRAPNSARGVTLDWRLASAESGPLPSVISWRERRWFADSVQALDWWVGLRRSVVYVEWDCVPSAMSCARPAKGETVKAHGVEAGLAYQTHPWFGLRAQATALRGDDRWMHGVHIGIHSGAQANFVSIPVGFLVVAFMVGRALSGTFGQ